MTAGPPINYARTRDGLDIAYTVTGKVSGFPFVKMPSPIKGILPDTNFPLNRGWISSCESRFHYVEYDGRGQGLSPRAIHSFTMDNLLDDLEAVVRAAAVRRFVLWATSFYWPTAIRYAAENPDRVAAMFLFDARAPGRDYAEKPEAFVRDHWDLFLRLVGLEKLGHSALLATNSALVGVERDDYVVMHRGFAAHNPAPWLPALRAPVLLIETTSTAQDEKDEVAALLPAARRVMLPGMIRAPTGENLEPTFNALDDFLRDYVPEALARSSVATCDDGSLTRREREILVLVAAGQSNVQIAGALVLSERTVARHIANIYGKLEVHNRAQATAYLLGRDSTATADEPTT